MQTSHSEESKIDVDMPSLSSFLRRMTPMMETELSTNASSTAFDGYETVSPDSSHDISYWRVLSVDLEKKKVVFPDWSAAKHSRGKITRCTVTRNKERLYDVDFDDELKLTGVREEHIRLLETSSRRNDITGKRSNTTSSSTSTSTSSSSSSSAAALQRLQDGVRLHVKISFKTGETKHLPGRVVKCNRNGTFDIECEGNSKIELGVPLEDLFIGLEEGQVVEARRPTTIQLLCTGVSWNASGGSIAVSYGRNDIIGWCEYPGAVCVWNLFSKNFSSENPDFTLDHSSCLTTVVFHPLIPSLIAAGSFNGEVIIWDLTIPESPIAVSPITEYSHKEPVGDLKWLHVGSGGGGGGGVANDWMLVSVGADGKVRIMFFVVTLMYEFTCMKFTQVLFWSLANRLMFPVKGSLLSVNGRSGKNNKR